MGLATDDVRVTVNVEGAHSEAYLELATVNSVKRRSHERTSCGRKGVNPMTFPISYKHLLDTLSVFRGDSVVDMLVMEDRSLLMVRDTTDAREVQTIIPFRTVEVEAEERKAADEAKAARDAAKAAAAAATSEDVAGVVEEA